MSDGAYAPYLLGHTNEELRRLILQSRFLGALSETFFARAGLKKGMQVLDVGCGAGDVSFLAAAFVGPEGSVLGVDQSEDSVALARQRAAEAGLDNVQFTVANLEDLSLGRHFDALVGRLVLIYMADPAEALKGMAAHVRSGGVVVMQEADMALDGSFPEVPLFETLNAWINEAFHRSGVDIRLGMRLPPIFIRAGLERPSCFSSARVESGPDAEIYEWMARTVRTLLPIMERTGVATGTDVGLDGLAERLREETLAAEATLYCPTLVGAWTTIR